MAERQHGDATHAPAMREGDGIAEAHEMAGLRHRRAANRDLAAAAQLCRQRPRLGEAGEPQPFVEAQARHRTRRNSRSLAKGLASASLSLLRRRAYRGASALP